MKVISIQNKQNDLNSTHRKKIVLYSVQYKNGYFAASDIFPMFTQSIKFYTFYCHISKSRSWGGGVVYSKVILVSQKILNKTSNLKMAVWKLPAQGATKILEEHM